MCDAGVLWTRWFRWSRWSGPVQPPAGRRDPDQDGRGVEVGVGEGAARQEADDQALALAVVQHRRTDARLVRGDGVGVLGVAVDAEQ